MNAYGVGIQRGLVDLCGCLELLESFVTLTLDKQHASLSLHGRRALRIELQPSGKVLFGLRRGPPPRQPREASE